MIGRDETREDPKACRVCGEAWDRHRKIEPGTTARNLRRLDERGKRCPRPRGER